jgi:hypothetical protein
MMKKEMLFLCLMISSFYSYAQQKCVVLGKIEAVRMNVLYIGVANNIQYAVSNTDTKTIKFSCEGCDSVEIMPDNRANVWVSKKGSVNIKVENNDIYLTNSFRVKYCPDPIIKLLGGQRGGIVTIEQLVKQRGILPKLENFDFSVKCIVKNFKLSRIREGVTQSFINEGNYFNDNNLNLIQSAQKGDIFTITEIKGECTGDKSNRDWGSMAFYVQ